MGTKKLSDEQFRKFKDRLGEFERRVDGLEIGYESAMCALQRMIHRNALDMSATGALQNSGLFSKEQALVAVNLLALNGCILNLTEDAHIRASLKAMPDENNRKHAILFDFKGMATGSIDRGIRISYGWNENGYPSVLQFDENHELFQLKSWPTLYTSWAIRLAISLNTEKHKNKSVAFLTYAGDTFNL